MLRPQPHGKTRQRGGLVEAVARAVFSVLARERQNLFCRSQAFASRLFRPVAMARFCFVTLENSVLSSHQVSGNAM